MQVRYFSALTDLIEALKPEVVGHIDLIGSSTPRERNSPAAC